MTENMVEEILKKVNEKLDEIGDFIGNLEDDDIYIRNHGQNDIMDYEFKDILSLMRKFNYSFHSIEKQSGECYLVFSLGGI